MAKNELDALAGDDLEERKAVRLDLDDLEVAAGGTFSSLNEVEGFKI